MNFLILALNLPLKFLFLSLELALILCRKVLDSLLCEKRRKFQLPAILSFHTMLSSTFKKQILNPFPHYKILGSSELKKFADNNFRFHVNGRRFSFQAISPIATVYKSFVLETKTGLLCERVIQISVSKMFSFSINSFSNKPFENTVGKGEIAPHSIFSFSHIVFYPFGELSAIFIELRIVACKLFQIRRV